MIWAEAYIGIRLWQHEVSVTANAKYICRGAEANKTIKKVTSAALTAATSSVWPKHWTNRYSPTRKFSLQVFFSLLPFFQCNLNIQHKASVPIYSKLKVKGTSKSAIRTEIIRQTNLVTTSILTPLKLLKAQLTPTSVQTETNIFFYPILRSWSCSR